MNQALKRAFIIEYMGGKSIYKIESCMECMGPIGEGKFSIVNQRKAGFDNVTVSTFGDNILFRCMGWCGIVRDTMGLEKGLKSLIFPTIIREDGYYKRPKILFDK